ncbi:MAG: hypothetical protein LBC60_09100 [Spirochaetaceae bacterium]|jgi:hypothetical protein|nr:hypothetical protein [Spirochaetaceae bacterium]
MLVNGRDCLIVIKTAYREVGIPYAEETIREAVSLLTEEAPIEGDGYCRAIRKSGGVTGCVVTPLTIGTAPLLFYLAMGSAGLPLYVSETRNLYLYRLNLLPMEDSTRFDLVQDRGGSRKLYEGCAVTAFELRINRGEAGQQASIKLKLDIQGERPAVVYPYQDMAPTETGERFMGDRVSYRINGTEYLNIYGLTVSTKKESGKKTELWIKRILEPGTDLPDLIEELTVTAQLYREKYEYRYYGMFRLTFTRLVLTADETAVDTGGTVIGPLRYYVAGTVNAEVFTTNDGVLTHLKHKNPLARGRSMAGRKNEVL